MRKDRNISMYSHLYIYIQACVCENGRKRKTKKARESLSFSPTAYPPPLLDGANEWKKERKIERKKQREKERGREREKARERAKRNTGGQGIVCDFVLPLAATSRSHSSISHTRAFSVALQRPLSEVSSYVPIVQKRTEAVCERTQSGLKSSCAPR